MPSLAEQIKRFKRRVLRSTENDARIFDRTAKVKVCLFAPLFLVPMAWKREKSRVLTCTVRELVSSRKNQDKFQAEIHWWSAVLGLVLVIAGICVPTRSIMIRRSLAQTPDLEFFLFKNIYILYSVKQVLLCRTKLQKILLCSGIDPHSTSGGFCARVFS